MQTNKPRVSLGIPVFNGEKYLALTLDSILAQTYTDFEVVISDNGSTDGTQQICESYAAKDKRIKYHRNPTNIGIAPNFNRALELSSGEYFKWTDYDDLLAPEFVAKCVDGLDQYPDAAVCFPKTRLIDENGGFIKDFEPPQDASSLVPHIRFKSLVLEPDHVVSQASGIMRAGLVCMTDMLVVYILRALFEYRTREEVEIDYLCELYAAAGKQVKRYVEIEHTFLEKDKPLYDSAERYVDHIVISQTIPRRPKIHGTNRLLRSQIFETPGIAIHKGEEFEKAH